MAKPDEETKADIAALLEERRGYEIYGDQAGIDAVNEQLRLRGYEAVKPSKRAEQRPAASRKKAEGR